MKLIALYLNKSHHSVIDNYYNSVGLSEKLLQQEIHTIGTLGSNRKRNSTVSASKKRKHNERIGSLWQGVKTCLNRKNKSLMLNNKIFENECQVELTK